MNYLFAENKESTGIRELDIIMEGGFTKPGIVAIKGDVGKEMNYFALSFASEVIKRGGLVFYNVSTTVPSDIEKKAEDMSMNIKTFVNDQLFFIDSYSGISGQRDVNRHDIIVESPSLLNELSLAINDALEKAKGKNFAFIFHTASAFLLHNEPASVVKFFQLNLGKIKTAGGIAILLIDKGTEQKDFISFVEYITDDYITIDVKEGTGYLNISGINVSIPIRSTAVGVEIL
ncbi:MAG: ATPase domain-containing protein [Candidatus Anstonellales archaeon]